MPDLQPPSWILADSTPGTSSGTNEAMPRFGGRVDPGQEVHVSVDGQETTIAPTGDGTWTWTSPELANGEHDFEMWTEDTATGDRSDSHEWTNDVDASEQDRSWQRARNEDWNKPGGGAEQFINENDKMAGVPPRPITGGGGGGAGQPMTDPQPGGGSGAGSGSQTGTSTPGGGGAPQGLEKGNATFGVVG